MKIKPSVFSLAGAIVISLFFTFSLFWIFYEYANSVDSTKDAINSLGGYFGGIATLWTTIIAAYLFNDWQITQTASLKQEQAQEIHMTLNKIFIFLDEYRDFILAGSGLGFDSEYPQKAQDHYL